MKRYFARKDFIAKLKNELPENFRELIPKKGKVEIAEQDDRVFVIVDGEVLFFKHGEEYIPSLKAALKIEINQSYVVVDKGAIPYIISGADVMRPGVVEFDENIKKGDVVIVKEEGYGKPIAIGKALWDGQEFKTKEKGKCVKNLHYIGDKIWKL